MPRAACVQGVLQSIAKGEGWTYADQYEMLGGGTLLALHLGSTGQSQGYQYAAGTEHRMQPRRNPKYPQRSEKGRSDHGAARAGGEQSFAENRNRSPCMKSTPPWNRRGFPPSSGFTPVTAGPALWRRISAVCCAVLITRSSKPLPPPWTASRWPP